MFSEQCNVQDRSGIMRLDQVGPYLVITNRWLHEAGESKRYVLINEAKSWVHSIHGSLYAAVVFAHKHTHQPSISSPQGKSARRAKPESKHE